MTDETHVLVDLYNVLEEQPYSIEIHERLLETWENLGVHGTGSLVTLPVNN